MRNCITVLLNIKHEHTGELRVRNKFWMADESLKNCFYYSVAEHKTNTQVSWEWGTKSWMVNEWKPENLDEKLHYSVEHKTWTHRWVEVRNKILNDWWMKAWESRWEIVNIKQEHRAWTHRWVGSEEQSVKWLMNESLRIEMRNCCYMVSLNFYTGTSFTQRQAARQAGCWKILRTQSVTLKHCLHKFVLISLERVFGKITQSMLGNCLF